MGKIWIFTGLLGALLTFGGAACDQARSRPTKENGPPAGSTTMPPPAVKYPNYSEMPNTPPLEEPGVALQLTPPLNGQTYRGDEPILLHGKCGANRDLNRRAKGYPLTCVEVQIGPQEKEEPLARRTIQESHVLPQGGEPPAGGADYLEFSYFNLDLASFFKALKEPGKYWVQAQFFEMKSDKLLFEVKK